MATQTPEAFVSQFNGQTLKWTEVTKHVGIPTAGKLKNDGKIVKVEGGWKVTA